MRIDNNFVEVYVVTRVFKPWIEKSGSKRLYESVVLGRLDDIIHTLRYLIISWLNTGDPSVSFRVM